MRGRMGGMQDQAIARWPFRVMAGFVVLIAFTAIAIFLRALIIFGDVGALAGIAATWFFGWRFWRIATTGKDEKLKSRLPENDS